MILYAFIIVALHCVGSFGCTLNSRRQYEGLAPGAPVDCFQLRDPGRIAVCLMQINTLQKLMSCSDSNPDAVLYWELYNHEGAADTEDMIPRDDVNNHVWVDDDDGYLALTPRGLLLEVLYRCTLTESDRYRCDAHLMDLFRKCPYSNFKKFQQCICCIGVNRYDMSQIETFIRGVQLGDTGYSLRDTLYAWTCPNLVCQGADTEYTPEAQLDGPFARRQDLTETFVLESDQLDLPPRTTYSYYTPTETPGDSTFFETYDVEFQTATGTESDDGGAARVTTLPSNNDDDDDKEDDEGAAFRLVPRLEVLVSLCVTWILYNVV